MAERRLESTELKERLRSLDAEQRKHKRQLQDLQKDPMPAELLKLKVHCRTCLTSFGDNLAPDQFDWYLHPARKQGDADHCSTATAAAIKRVRPPRLWPFTLVWPRVETA